MVSTHTMHCVIALTMTLIGSTHGWSVLSGSSRKSTLEGSAFAKSGVFMEVGYDNCMVKCNLMVNDSGAVVPSPFSFYRANNPLYFKDMQSAVPASSVYQSGKGITWLQGDMHILNMGTFAVNISATYTSIFDINDYDETWTGSWLYDMYRLAASLVIAGRASGVSDSNSKDTVKELALRYFNKLKDFKSSNDEDAYIWDISQAKDVPSSNSPTNNPIYDLLVKATGGSQASRRQDMLDKYSVKVSGTRQFDWSNSDVVPVSSSIRSAIIAALPAYYNSMSGPLNGASSYFAVQDVAERVNAGLGSLGTTRYYVIVEGATSDADDDRILDIKVQGFPKPYTAGLLTGPAYAAFPSANDQAARASYGYKKLIYKADNHIGELSFAGRVFSVRERSPEKESLDPSGYSKTQLFNMATQYGKVLASSHSKTDGNGVDTFESEAYSAITSYGIANFQLQLADFATTYADQVASDWAIFKSSFAANANLWCGSPSGRKFKLL